MEVPPEALKNSASDADIDPETRHILAVEMGVVSWSWCPSNESHEHRWVPQTDDMTSYGFVVVCADCRWAGQAKVIEGNWPVLWKPPGGWLGRMKRDYRRMKRAGTWQFCPRRGRHQEQDWPALGNHVYTVIDTGGAMCRHCGQRVPITIYNHPWPQAKVRAVKVVPA